MGLWPQSPPLCDFSLFCLDLHSQELRADSKTNLSDLASDCSLFSLHKHPHPPTSYYEEMSETECKLPAKNEKPKPCCVCLDEKKLRDECLLFNGQEGGKCDDLIAKYKVCMKGFGFETR
ncbi:hypothetical protein CAAN1_23S00606 [[Candida] anglica]|uniref:Cytochrome c oxidase copper chaperone n=1 Tax=[Candida] anglica TaxID=148631 RepID=A0ABP0E9T1_9ASCO